MTQKTGSVYGIPIRATIERVDIQSGLAYVRLSLTQTDGVKPIKIPAGWIGPRGQVSAGYPQRGTSLFVQLGQGNEWVFVGYDQPDSTSTYDRNGTRRVDSASMFRDGRWLTLVENDVSVIVDPDYGVSQGSSSQFTQADPGLGLWSSRFNEEMHFTESHREVKGPVLRDLGANSARNVDSSALTGHQYNSSLTKVGLDPRTAPSIAFAGTRNPLLAETRAMYYEFANSYGFVNDDEENNLYASGSPSATRPLQRSKLRTDTMDLSLDRSNYLAESIIGTVIDIYGNILDINRSVLPNGIVDSLNLKKSQLSTDLVFRKLREQIRKSVACHFELNARKEPNIPSADPRIDPGIYTPDYTDTTNYARNRSRFFFDIDKEGQFKGNVPASSEVGNVGLLVRYENFSNVYGQENNQDRGAFIRNPNNNTDIQIEPHGKGCVTLKSNDSDLKSYAAPNSRLDGSAIQLGTGFHTITSNLSLFKINAPYSSTGTGGYPASQINNVPPITDVVSSSLIVSGQGANAGGRSGTLSLDGMVSISVGANTVDRQSLWLDCAGGIVMAVGRDQWQRSLSANFDGDILIEVGGTAITDDSRFSTQNNTLRDGAIDIRVHNSGSFHTIRIDSQGIKIHTPQRIDIVSEGEMRFKSVNANMYFDAESIFFYAGTPGAGRLVNRASTGTAGKTI